MTETNTISNTRLTQIINAYINNDLESVGETSYVKEILRNHCGCSDDEIIALGLDFLLDANQSTTANIALSNTRLMQILNAYICNDLEGASEISYIRETLSDYCGCTDEEFAILGLSFLLDAEDD